MFSTVDFSRIAGLQAQFPILGYLKIGTLGQERTSKSGTKFRLPVKLDYIRVTQRVRDAEGQFALDEEVHKIVGEKPTELAVTLLYDDPTLNCPSRLACYQGSRRWCHGNGAQALRLDAQSIYRDHACPCPLLMAPESAEENKGKSENQLIKCKPNGSLGVQLPCKQSSIGIYRFRTTSLESIQSILTVQSAILMRTGGVLGGVPLRLRLYPATDNTPGGASKSWKITLDLPAGGWAEVDEAGREIVRARSSSRVAMKAIEADARRKMKALGTGTAEADALIDELFPRPVTECGGVEVLDDEPDGSIIDLEPVQEGTQTAAQDPVSKGGPADGQPTQDEKDEIAFLEAYNAGAEALQGLDLKDPTVKIPKAATEAANVQLAILEGMFQRKDHLKTLAAWPTLKKPLADFTPDQRLALFQRLIDLRDPAPAVEEPAFS